MANSTVSRSIVLDGSALIAQGGLGHVAVAASAYQTATADTARNMPHFEEAIRVLFANDQRRFCELVARWPEDVRNRARFRRGPRCAHDNIRIEGLRT